MALKTERLEIEGAVYEVLQLSTDEGIDLYEELLQVFGPAVNKIDISKVKNAESLFVQVLLNSVASMPRGLLLRLSHIYRARTKIRVSTGHAELWVPLLGEVYDEQFAGAKMKAWSKWIGGCLRLSFADFFDEAAAFGKSPSTAAPSP
jgi:hypothetical protein